MSDDSKGRAVCATLLTLTLGLLPFSDLYRGYIHVTNFDGSSFGESLLCCRGLGWHSLTRLSLPLDAAEIPIPHVSSPQPFGTPYQLAGLSLDRPNKPTRLYGVAKDRQAFVFKSSDPTQSVSPDGANRFVAFDLPVNANSQPAWSVRLDRVQDRLAKKLGGKARPFGPVDSVQDKEGNSYVVFALGAPAIAKIDPTGKSIEAWAIEAPKSSRLPRVGYTGISYDAESNRLIAYGGPRTLTMFDLSSKTPNTPIPVKIEGSLRVSAITAAEKINLVQCESIRTMDNPAICSYMTDTAICLPVFCSSYSHRRHWPTSDGNQRPVRLLLQVYLCLEPLEHCLVQAVHPRRVQDQRLDRRLRGQFQGRERKEGKAGVCSGRLLLRGRKQRQEGVAFV